MPERAQPICEVLADGSWQPVALIEARGPYAFAPKRCPACHGPVVIAGNYTARGSLKMQHRRAHHGCPLKPETYSGVPSPHPDALT